MGRGERAWLSAVVLVGIALVLTGAGCRHVPDQSLFLTMNDRPAELVVQLRCAKVPQAPAIADHCWFAEFDRAGGRWHRWEVMRYSAGPWGHVQRDVMSADAGVGAGPSWVLHEFRGDSAAHLRDVLYDPQGYPLRDRYRYWPGPNSNTYVAWVLREADVDASLPGTAIGRGYPCPVSASAPRPRSSGH